jgi:hypothetical protein
MRTYGTIVYNQKAKMWMVDCEPQVAMRLKRTFGKVAKTTQGTIWLYDTVETGRDLAWFETRYPMHIPPPDRDRLNQMDQQHRELSEDIGRILSADYVPRDVQLALPPRGYQKIAIDLARRTRGTLIADDVGLGKTVDGIGVISDPAFRPALVVTLTHLPRQWKAEIERFLPGLRVHILKKGTPYRLNGDGLFDRGLPDVIISNYHKLSGWAPELAGNVRSVILDEIQELRHDDSYKYLAAKSVAEKAECRLGLSATPIFNYGGEIYNIMEVLRPGHLGTWTEFANEWCGNYSDRKKASLKDPKVFGSYAREAGLILRRTRADVGRELPGLTIVPHVIDADTDILDDIKGTAAELAKVILAQGGAAFDKMRASEEFSWRLRQATGIAKAPFVADFVRLLVEQGEKVLLGGWHHEVYRLWKARLADLNPVLFTGEETPNQKEESKQAFLSSNANVLIMSLRAGAGIDGLQKVCRTVVFGELDWSPSVHEQFTGRVGRDGQKDPVVAYYLTADSGSDPVIADVLGIKRGQLDGIRDPSAPLVAVNQTDPDRMKKLAQDYLKRSGQVRTQKSQSTDDAAAGSA